VALRTPNQLSSDAVETGNPPGALCCGFPRCPSSFVTAPIGGPLRLGGPVPHVPAVELGVIAGVPRLVPARDGEVPIGPDPVA
jgi:hypothetical protein